MESQGITQLERRLADYVDSYRRLCEGGTAHEQTEELRQICSVMGRLLGSLLQTDARWNKYWWVDDVLPTSGTFLVDHQFRLEGEMIWGQKGSAQQWVEPCAMTATETAGVFKYQILCGDVLRGLGKLSYDHRSNSGNQITHAHWIFTFSH